MSFIRQRGIALFVAVCAVSGASSVRATSFVVPPDREMVKQADAIVMVTAINSRTQLRDGKIIETVTMMSVDEVIKGSFRNDTIEIWEPGGAYEKRVKSIPGVPRFQDGERYLLFLIRGGNVWRVLNLVLGKFTFETDVLGHEVLLRDSHEIVGWDPDGSPHREMSREAGPFLDFVRVTAKGGPAREEYMIPAEDLIASQLLRRGRLQPLANCTVNCTPTSYTYIYNTPSTGARWTTFPVNFFSRSANAAALTALNNAIGSWNNDPSSSVVLVDAGADPGSHTGGVAAADGQNTVAFEKDLHAEYGAPGFSCAGNSYSGTLGIAAVTDDSGTHVGPNGETFASTSEGDVEMNTGLSTCTFFINRGDFSSAVAHELGHTLGFRHSDQARNLFPGPASACSTDSTLECSSSAIMTAFIPGLLSGALQTWDQHAVDTLYPNNTPAAVTSVVATPTSTTTVQVTWTGSCVTTCHIYRSDNRTAYTEVGTGSSPYNDTTASAGVAYLYKVRAFNGLESGDSNLDLATTVIFTNATLVAGSTPIQAVHLTELRTAVNAVRKLANNGTANDYNFTNPTITAASTLVQAVHITDLRTALDQAMGTLGMTTGGYTDTSLSGVIVKAVHFQELRNRVK